MKKWKDRVLNALMLLAVGGAFFVTWRSPAPEPEEPLPLPVAAVPTAVPTAVPDPIAAYRERREKDRQREEETLLALIRSENTSETLRADAEAQLLQMQQNMETELAVEAALLSRGRTDALCVARQGAVTVLMNGEIGEQDAALILQLAQEAAGTDAENIRISGY